ncbi:hypothetical protein EI94DRAFT_1118035 [Lactarius quietus]|nr:hypothetical protein EI94DRAFT_1118035 [Lactarius quietus]
MVCSHWSKKNAISEPQVSKTNIFRSILDLTLIKRAAVTNKHIFQVEAADTPDDVDDAQPGWRADVSQSHRVEPCRPTGRAGHSLLIIALILVSGMVLSDMVMRMLLRHNQQLGDRRSGFTLRVICEQFDWQINSAAQICGSLIPFLFCVEDLTLNFDEHEMPTEWQNGAVDGAAWHDLLKPFVGAKTLCVCNALAWELSCALQSGDVGLNPELLPVLQVLDHRLEAEHRYNFEAFASFVDARRISDRPVCLLRPVRLLSRDLPDNHHFDQRRFHRGLFNFRDRSRYSLKSSSSDANLLANFNGVSWFKPQSKYLNNPCTLPVRVENDIPPFRTTRSVKGSVKIQLQPPPSETYPVPYPSFSQGSRSPMALGDPTKSGLLA